MKKINEISVPRFLLSAVMDMANSHLQDIHSGIEDGIYNAAENPDIGEKQRKFDEIELIYRNAVMPHSLMGSPPRAGVETPTGEVIQGGCHTPGPWGQSAAMSSDAFNMRYVSGANGERVATVSRQAGMSQEEAIANCDAITAAPVMLASLMTCEAKLVEWVESSPPMAASMNGVGDVLVSLRSAIKQAMKHSLKPENQAAVKAKKTPSPGM